MGAACFASDVGVFAYAGQQASALPDSTTTAHKRHQEDDAAHDDGENGGQFDVLEVAGDGIFDFSQIDQVDYANDQERQSCQL